jgi:hypothetical protein
LRRFLWVLGIVGGLVLSFALALYWFGAFDGVIAKWRFGRDRAEYQAAAERVVRKEAASASDRVFVWSPASSDSAGLAVRPEFVYFRVDGRHYVYFMLADEVTMSSGLVYSASGHVPPNPPAYAPEKLDEHWFSVSFVNGLLEYGRLDQ